MGTRLIQEGPRDAKIVLVGEAPGANEEREGRPFIGGAGELLDRMLSRSGISRSDCFVTNLCHVRPPDNKFEWFYKKENQLAYIQGLLQLKADLEGIHPNIVVALGAHPLRALTGKNGIEKWRGSILPCALIKGLKVVGTFHPAAILRTYDYKAVAEMDFRYKVVPQSVFPEIIYPKRTFYLPNEKIVTREGVDWVTKDEPYSIPALVERLVGAPEITIDIECSQDDYGKWHLACVGFSDSPDWALVLDASVRSSREYIRQLCSTPAKKILQNGMFDVTVLESEGIKVENFWWDTMLAHHALYPECASAGDEMTSMNKGPKRQSAIGKGLAFLTSINTDEPYYKEDSKLWKLDGDIVVFHRYNALDVAVTHEVRQVQQVDLIATNTMRVREHAQRLVPPILFATNRGIKIDVEQRAAMREDVVAQIDRLQQFLNAQAGETVNVKSNPQITKLLYDKFKLPKKFNKKSGNLTADKDAIIELAGKSNHPFLLTILKIREKRDLLERYLDTAIDADNRMRCTLDITGTRSGRLASRASIHGSGTNLQNQPKYIRKMFISDEGKVFIQRDYSQADARVVAYLSRCDGLIELFEDPTRDIHSENASRIFGIPLSQIARDSTERYLAKKVIHASNYGMGEMRLVQVVNEEFETTGIRIDYRQAKELIDKYFAIYPEIKQNFWRYVDREIGYSRQLTNAFGRVRTFYARRDDKLLREAYSYIPQSTVGDLAGTAIYNVFEQIQLARPELGAEFMMQVHDSILVQCNEDSVDEVARLMDQAMHIPITLWDRTFYIPTDCEVGYNWGPKGKDGSNPRGLTAYAGVAA